MTDLSTIDTTIYIGSVAIHQPVTVFTSYLITAMCFYYYWKLKQIKNIEPDRLFWSRFFLYVGSASLVGSCSHAFFALHEGSAYKAFWLPMQVLNIFSVYCGQQATLYSVLQHSPKKKVWKLSYDIQLIIFVSAVFIFHNFLVVVIDGVLGMIPVMILHFKHSSKQKSYSWIAYGILILFLAAIVNVTKFSIHAYFNHLDIAHLFVMANLAVMYEGVKRKTTS
jgi:hypothetical protein